MGAQISPPGLVCSIYAGGIRRTAHVASTRSYRARAHQTSAMLAVMTQVLLVTGPVGVGKTAVVHEAHRLLMAARIPHAAVVLETLDMSWPVRGDDGLTERVAYRNLACVWANFAAAGAQRLLLERVLEQRSQLQEL